ncbi:MAG: DNA polymerase I [Deltaproteobacteria bacterium]|nr:DNA polymerase I [Deltaproteobacteria bacterium]
MSQRLFLIDGSGFIFRAFYGVRRLSTSTGVPTNAVFGFATMMMKLLRDHAPTHVAVVFDTKEPTFRHEIYPDYKANRDAPPDDLVPQFGLIRELVDAFGWPRIERAGFEADDVIGTLADRGAESGFEVVIVSSDKDLCQLLAERVRMYDPMKDVWTGPDDLKERFGGGPERVVEVLALAGDTSDNVPGIPGVGEKTAVKLLDEFGSFDAVLENAAKIKGKLAEKVMENVEAARLARRLVTIERGLDLGMGFDELRLTPTDREKLGEFLGRLEMSRLLSDLQAVPAQVESSGQLSRDGYRLVTDRETLNEMIGKMRAAGEFALDTETTSEHPTRADIVGMSFCCDGREAFYLPVAHHYLGVPAQISLAEALDALRPLLTDASVRKVGQNIKYDQIVFRRAGVDLRGVDFDTMVASYLLEPEADSHGMDVLASKYLGHRTIKFKDVTGSGKDQKGFAEVPLDMARDYAAEDAHVTWELYRLLAPLIEREGFDRLLREMEMPLIDVLVDMEMAGVLIDPVFFRGLSKEADGELVRLEAEIHQAAGGPFNLNSPKQVGEILFEKLGLPSGKKTKTGYSTDVTVLESLADKHVVPKLLLEYRAFHKLKSTYIDALPSMINPRTGRVHTSFNQAVAATGRLSSSDPNLQNIPIRTKQGRRIREGFVAPEGRVLLSADYSQVELRILAHLSGDAAMLDAFASGGDIHRSTAAQVFGVELGSVTPEMRRQAKAVNFGIVYGMSAFRLGRDLEIGTKRAQEFIDAYFGRFAGVKTFIERTIADAREKGFVTTMMGRRRRVPELVASNRQVQSFGERLAVNTPIQGSAADIIKVAMVRLRARVAREAAPMTMILQVHDELVFEVDAHFVDEAATIVREEMENVVKLDAPLRVETSHGNNWAEAH